MRGKGYWKINLSILDEEEYIKQLQANKIKWLEKIKDIEDFRMTWELFKYKIRQFSMRYSKTELMYRNIMIRKKVLDYIDN